VLLFGFDDSSDRNRVIHLFRMMAHQADLSVLLGLHPQEAIALCRGESSA